MIKKVEDDYEWTFNNYYKALLSKRDPKHDTHSHRAYHKTCLVEEFFGKENPYIDV